KTLAQRYVVLQPRDERGFAMERFLRSHSAADQIAVRVNHFNAMLSAVEQSDLIGTVPAQILDHLGMRFEVAPLETKMPEREFRLLMIWHRSQTHDPANRWLRDQVASLLQAGR
ncbi:MAG: LysR substrate-binding domain-containing protein, partial [Pseudomonadota bacterium]